MATVVITIETDSVAFLDNPTELGNVLQRMAQGIERDNIANLRAPRDSNGNTVGTVEVKGGE